MKREAPASFVAAAGAEAQALAGIVGAAARSLDRPMQDAALRDAVQASVPLIGFAGLTAAFCAAAFVDPGRTMAWIWVASALAVWLAWAVLAAALFGGGRADATSSASPLAAAAFGPMAAANVGVLAAAPWLAGPVWPDASTTIANASLFALAMAGAVLLAPLHSAARTFAALPFSVALAALVATLSGAATAGAGWLLAAGAAIASALAFRLADTRHRIWRRAARVLLEREQRIAELEAGLDRAQRADHEKSRFLGIASHDLRQPVHALGLFAATLERRLHGSPEEPLVRNIMRAVDGLDRSFNAMLDISRLDVGTIEPNIQHFPLRDLFRRLHMQFAGQAELVGLNLRFSPGGKSVNSDPYLLERILGNLVQNALKYTEQGGVVVLARTSETHVNVEIWDTGRGIDAAELPRIFDEFYQVGQVGHRDRDRSQGLGMGLAIVRRLALLLGLRLVVSSRLGRGTMFRVGIPRGGLAEFQDVTAAADTVPGRVLQARTVLIVDDEEAIRDGLCLLLEEWGYNAVACASAEQVESTMSALPGGPDLVISDLHLGSGPDGIEVIATVRRVAGYPVPAILVTGDTSREEIRRVMESGHSVLFKPVLPRKLYDAVIEQMP